MPPATVVTDTRIVPHFSWGAAFAGALIATVVALLLIALGSGVGLTFVSPYDSDAPSAATLAIAGVIWIIFAQGLGYAVGGYVAGRLRSPGIEGEVESNFRDGAHGLVAWAIGVLLTLAFAIFVGMSAAGTAARVGGSLGAGAAVGLGSAASNRSASPANDSTSYFVDTLFRADSTQPLSGPAPGSAQTPQGETAPRNMALQDSRAEVGRTMQFGLVGGKLSNADRTYVSQLVARQTGVSSTLADQRVAEFERRAGEAAKKTADVAAKSGAYFSIWVFMALLVGATAAVIGAIWGGDNRDARPARPMFHRRPRPATVRR